MDDLTTKIQTARQAGVSSDEILQYIESKGLMPTETEKGLPVNPKRKELIQSLIDPLARYGKFVGAGLVQAPVLAATGGKVNIPIMSEEELQKLSGDTLGERLEKTGLEGVKATAGAMSYAIPGGQTWGQLLLRGATAGALLGFSEDRDLVSSAMGGAVGGIVGGKVLPAVLRKGGELLGKTGVSLAEKVVKPKVVASPFAAEEEKTIVKGLQELGISGSAQAQREQIPTVFRQLTDKIKSLLPTFKISSKFGVNGIKKHIKDALSENINFDPKLPIYKKAQEKFINQLRREAGGKRINYQTLFNFKQNLGKQLSRAFDKVEKGNPLSPAEEVGITIWGSIDNILPKEIKHLTRLQSLLYKASPGLMKSAEKGVSIPIIGKLPSVISEPIQAGTSKAGQVLTKTAPLVSEAGSIPTTMLPAGLPTVGEAFGRVAGTRTVIPEKEQIPTIQGLETTTELPMVNGEEKPLLTNKEAMLLMLQYPKQAALIEKIYKMGQPKLTAQESDAINSAKGGVNLVNTLEQNFNNVVQAGLTATGPGVGRLSGLRGSVEAFLQTSPEAANYYDTVDAFMSLLSRAAGEKGVLTDQDIKRIKKAVPTFYDTQETAARKWQTIKTVITAKVQDKLNEAKNREE